jgi:hypothetical protein
LNRLGGKTQRLTADADGSGCNNPRTCGFKEEFQWFSWEHLKIITSARSWSRDSGAVPKDNPTKSVLTLLERSRQLKQQAAALFAESKRLALRIKSEQASGQKTADWQGQVEEPS